MKLSRLTFTLALIIVSLLEVAAQFQLRHTNAASIYFWPTAIDMNNAGGYVIGGQSLYPNIWRPFITRTDKNGNIIWSNMYEVPGSTGNCTDLKNVTWTSKFWTVAVGKADSGPAPIGATDAWMTVVDKAGNPVYGWRYGTNKLDLATAVQAIDHPVHGKGFVLTGYTVNNSNDLDLWVIITDSAGNIVDQTYFENPGIQKPTAIQMTTNHDFIVVGETNTMNNPCDTGDKNVLAMKLDQNLNLQWSRVVDIALGSNNTTSDVAEAVQMDPNNPSLLFVSGTSRVNTSSGLISMPFLIQMKEWKVLWVKNYKIGNHTLGGRGNDMITQTTPSGDVEHILSCDFINGTAPFSKSGLIKVDENGEVIWSKAYPPGYSQSSTRAESIVLNDIDGFTFTGRIFDAYPPSTGYQNQLAKLKINGASGTDCEEKVEVGAFEPKYCEENFNPSILQPLLQVAYSPNVIGLNLKVTTCKEDAQATTGGRVQGKLMISPNPANRQFFIKSKTGVADVRIFNSYGIEQKIASFQADQPISIGEFDPGLYIVEIHFENGTVERHSLIKE